MVAWSVLLVSSSLDDDDDDDDADECRRVWASVWTPVSTSSTFFEEEEDFLPLAASESESLESELSESESEEEDDDDDDDEDDECLRLVCTGSVCVSMLAVSAVELVEPVPPALERRGRSLDSSGRS